MNRWLNLLILLSLLPSLLALSPRLQAERPGPVALVVDAEALREEAKVQGKGLLEVLAAYRALGVNGVAFPERFVKDWVAGGVLLLTVRGGSFWRRGFPPGQAGTT
jgi:hypothetical protein